MTVALVLLAVVLGLFVYRRLVKKTALDAASGCIRHRTFSSFRNPWDEP